MNPTEKILDSVPTSWAVKDAAPCDPLHPASALGTFDCKTYALFLPNKPSAAGHSCSSSRGRGSQQGPWTLVVEVKQMIYELLALELVAYIDTDSPRVVQVEVSRDKLDWTFVAAFDCPRPWGNGHRMPTRPHPDTMEVNVARTLVGSSTMHWRLPPCPLKYPQFARLSIPQTFSGQPPSLHYLKLSHRVGRPRARSAPDMTVKQSTAVASPAGEILERRPVERRPVERVLSWEEEGEDVLGPLLTTRGGFAGARKQRRGST
jgi:hypothetical protein